VNAGAPEVHDYHDVGTGVLAATLVGRAVGYTSLGLPDPRRITPPRTPAPRQRRTRWVPRPMPPRRQKDTTLDMTDRL